MLTIFTAKMAQHCRQPQSFNLARLPRKLMWNSISKKGAWLCWLADESLLIYIKPLLSADIFIIWAFLSSYVRSHHLGVALTKSKWGCFWVPPVVLGWRTCNLDNFCCVSRTSFWNLLTSSFMAMYSLTCGMTMLFFCSFSWRRISTPSSTSCYVEKKGKQG